MGRVFKCGICEAKASLPKILCYLAAEAECVASVILIIYFNYLFC